MVYGWSGYSEWVKYTTFSCNELLHLVHRAKNCYTKYTNLSFRRCTYVYAPSSASQLEWAHMKVNHFCRVSVVVLKLQVGEREKEKEESMVNSNGERQSRPPLRNKKLHIIFFLFPITYWTASVIITFTFWHETHELFKPDITNIACYTMMWMSKVVMSIKFFILS